MPESPDMERPYPYNFSSAFPAMRDTLGRERKARTMGIIDNVLAEHFGSVVGMNIDVAAIEHAQRAYRRDNLPVGRHAASWLLPSYIWLLRKPSGRA